MTDRAPVSGPHPFDIGDRLVPPLYRSGLTIGQTIFIDHPEMGQTVGGVVVGEIPATGTVVVELDGTGQRVWVPMSMLREASHWRKRAGIETVVGEDHGIPILHLNVGDGEYDAHQWAQQQWGTEPHELVLIETQHEGLNRSQQRYLAACMCGSSAAWGSYSNRIQGAEKFWKYHMKLEPWRTASTWRGFVKDNEPFWKWADIVISTERAGRGRHYEVYVHGEAWRNFTRLDAAKAALISEFGSLEFTQHTMDTVTVEHYYYGPTDFTDPQTIYLADL